MATKIIIFILCLAGIWYGFKLLGRAAESRPLERDDDRYAFGRRRNKPPRSNRAKAGRDPQGSDPDDDTEVMIKCKSCGAYVSASSASNCGRDDCPYG